MEVEFSAAPEYTDELTFKYYILVNGKLLTGEVTHTNIADGRDIRSVMYVSPQDARARHGQRPLAAEFDPEYRGADRAAGRGETAS